MFYLLFFLAVGVTLPFMPAYFVSLGISPTQVGVLLAVNPVLSLLMPPWWGQLADRTGHPGVVLLVLCLGGLLGYSVLLGASGFGSALVAMALYSVFGSSVTAIVDSLSLQHLARTGGSYAHVRRWGSFGFVVATLGFGYSIVRVDRLAVLAPMLFLAGAALWCGLTLARAPRVTRTGPQPTVKAALGLLRNKPFALLLLATMLHWVASTPYHGSLGTHFTDLGLPPWTVGLTWGVAVSSEVVVMTLWPRWSHLLSAHGMLLVSFGVSALRWWSMAATDNVVLLAALAAVHGISFGAFYVSAVAEVAKHTPESLRATGQALFTAITFGVGGLIGYASSGVLYTHLGGHQLFAIAGVVELLPIAVLLNLRVQKSEP